MTVGPAERDLDDGVNLIKEQIRGQLKAAPQRRLRALEIDTDLVGDDLRPARPAPRDRSRRLGRGGEHAPRSWAGPRPAIASAIRAPASPPPAGSPAGSGPPAVYRSRLTPPH